MTTKKGKGRPTKFTAKFKHMAQYVCERWGATDNDLAELFEVTEQTINNWKKSNPDFFESLKQGKAVADARVERALFERALGYSHPDLKFATHEGRITDEREYIKHLPPDTTAGIFWLKNRKPEQWRDKVDLEHGGDVNISVTVTEKKKDEGQGD